MLSNIGVPGYILFINIIFLIFGLFILYIVISKAVKEGINQSVVGQFILKNDEIKANEKSLIDSDLDNGE